MVALANIRSRRDDILRLATKHGAQQVRVFGSVMRGQALAHSDLDLLVHFDEDRSLIDQVALKLDLEDLLGCPVDVVEDDALHRSVREGILAEAVAL